MNIEITFYSNHCPRCKILEAKLKQKSIKYSECNDEAFMLSEGFRTVPVLEIDGKRMNFGEAMNWAAKYGEV
jgi:glutaredoxin